MGTDTVCDCGTVPEVFTVFYDVQYGYKPASSGYSAPPRDSYQPPPQKSPTMQQPSSGGGSAASSKYGGGDKCPRCNKTVYFAEAREGPNNIKYHKMCFNCVVCRKVVDSTFTERQGEIYCKSCYGKEYGPKGNKQRIGTSSSFFFFRRDMMLAPCSRYQCTRHLFTSQFYHSSEARAHSRTAAHSPLNTCFKWKHALILFHTYNSSKNIHTCTIHPFQKNPRILHYTHALIINRTMKPSIKKSQKHIH